MENGSQMTAELYPEIAPNTVKNFISLIQKGFAYFVPITLEIRRTLLSWDFDPQLGSDFHCHITRIGSHLFQLSLTFLSQLLSSSSFFTFGFKYSNDSFRCQVKSLFSQAFHAQ